MNKQQPELTRRGYKRSGGFERFIKTKKAVAIGLIGGAALFGGVVEGIAHHSNTVATQERASNNAKTLEGIKTIIRGDMVFGPDTNIRSSTRIEDGQKESNGPSNIVQKLNGELVVHNPMLVRGKDGLNWIGYFNPGPLKDGETIEQWKERNIVYVAAESISTEVGVTELGYEQVISGKNNVQVDYDSVSGQFFDIQANSIFDGKIGVPEFQDL
ncbi:MAG: hypothetical protein ABI220_00925 [Candidatus Saccharimonadales bacterium]